MNDTNLLSALNTFTRRNHSLDEVYLFDLILCDNEIDRDGDCFSDEALDTLCKLFVGVTGIFDHNPKADSQTARIFHTEVLTDPQKHTKTGKPYRCLKANAYMIRTDSNADLIREIDGGIKKEVSISCACGKQICSICGANKLESPCSHIKGRSYGGAPCFCTLDAISDAYEWSFVAVPAQKHAGVTKTLGGLHAAAPETAALSKALDSANGTLNRLTDALRRDVIRLCFRDGDSACAKALADSALHLDADALLRLQQKLASAPQTTADFDSQLYPKSPQAPADSNTLGDFRLRHDKDGDCH